MLAARVDDVLPTVGTSVLLDPGHQRSQKISGADHKAELLAGMKYETNRQQLDYDFGDFARGQLLDAVEAMSGHLIGRQHLVEVAS